MEFVPELSQKRSGAYFTPDGVAASLVAWAVHKAEDRMLDPSCGDGQFVTRHRNVVGLEQNPESARVAMDRAPWALIHEGDFFSWASATPERFECAAGNPPFIRYQVFNGHTKAKALEMCRRHGVEFSGLVSAWAPFLVATAGLLAKGGRMAFVVPAEIGHAPYAAPLLEYLLSNFSEVHVIAVREKLFPRLSEDCWLLYAQGKGGQSSSLSFTTMEKFSYSPFPPAVGTHLSIEEWRSGWSRRLRPYLISRSARNIYLNTALKTTSKRLSDFARVGIGYVSGANDFFHLRPSEAEAAGINAKWLMPTLRNSRAIGSSVLSKDVVQSWHETDEQMLLLRLPKDVNLDASLRRYLNGEKARAAKNSYKCRNRDPWYSVPDVRVPDFFLSYMSGRAASLVRNEAGITCANSIHAVSLTDSNVATRALAEWDSPLTRLSCEVEGHALGGGMLKLEPREAGRLLFAPDDFSRSENEVLQQAVLELQCWRHLQ